MEDLKARTGQLKDHAREYVKTYADLAKAKATKSASTAAAGMVIGVAALILSFFFLFFGAFSLAWWLGDLMGSHAAGFLAVAGLFLLLVVILFALRKKTIIPMIRNAVIRKVYE